MQFQIKKIKKLYNICKLQHDQVNHRGSLLMTAMEFALCYDVWSCTIEELRLNQICFLSAKCCYVYIFSNLFLAYENRRWMNGQHLRALPSEELTKLIGERWKSTGLLTESEGPFIDVSFFLKYSLKVFYNCTTSCRTGL